jgi:hypothetical protein
MELQWEKIIKTKQKKKDDVSFLPTELPTEFFPSEKSEKLLVNYSLLVFSRELWNYSLPNCTVNYCFLQTKSPTDRKVVGVIWRFSKKFRLN